MCRDGNYGSNTWRAPFVKGVLSSSSSICARQCSQCFNSLQPSSHRDTLITIISQIRWRSGKLVEGAQPGRGAPGSQPRQAGSR